MTGGEVAKADGNTIGFHVEGKPVGFLVVV
jgi:hypothetical protein